MSNKELEFMASEYCKAKQQIKKIEESVEAYKQILISAAKESGGKLVVGEYQIASSEKTRENFSLSKAKAVIDMNILKPFLSETRFDDLRVKRLAEEE